MRELGNVFGFGADLGAALLIQHHVPRDAHQPNPQVANLAQLILVAQYPQKGLLHSVFRFRRVAAHRVGNAIQRAGKLLHQRADHLGRLLQAQQRVPEPLWLQSNSRPGLQISSYVKKPNLTY